MFADYAIGDAAIADAGGAVASPVSPLRDIYESTYDVRGWGDPTGTLPGWFDDDLALPAAVVALSGVGALSATGAAPTVAVSNHQSIATGVGALTVTGQAPTVAVSNNQFVSAGVGALVAAGFAAVVVLGTVASPSVGTVAVTGFAPTVVIGTRAYPDAGVLTLTGQSPTVTVSNNQSATPSVGVLSVAGFAPTVTVSNNQSAAPGAGVLAVAGVAPSVVLGMVAYPSVGALAAAGFAPSAVVGIRVFPGVGSLTVDGRAPSATAPANVAALPGVGALDITAFAPTIVLGTVAYPGTGQATLVGFAPTAVATGHQIVLPATGALTVAGMAPSVAISNNRFIAPLNGDLTITGFAPSAILGIVVRPDVGAVVLDGFAPDVAVTHNVAAVPGVGSLVVNGFAPSINAPVAVPIGAGELTVTGYAPTINGAVAGPRPTTVTLDQPIATVALSHVATVSLETFARGVTIDQPIATATLAHTATVTLTAVSATVELGDAVGGPPDGGGGGGTEGEAVTGTGALSVTGFAPSVVATGPQTATPGVGALIVTGFAPNAVATGPQSVAPGVGSLVVVGMRPHIPGASGEPSDADLADPSYILDTMFPEVTAQILADGGTPNVVASQSFRHAQTTSVDDVGVVWTGVPVPEGYDPGPESSVAIDLDSDDPLSPPTAYRKHQKLAWTPGGVGHDSLMMEPIVSGSLPNFWLCFTLRIRKPFIAPASNGQKIFDWFESNPTDPSHPGFGWFQYGWSGGPLGAANDLPVLADDRLGVFFTPEGPPELGGSYNVQTGEGGTLMHVATDEWVRLAVGLKASSAYGVEDGRLMAYVNGVKNIDRAFKSTAGDFIRFDWQCMFGGDIGSLQQHYDYLNTVSGFEDVVAADNVYECGHIAIIRAV